MTRFGRLLGLIVAVSGFAAAHVLVQTGSAMELPPVTTVNITVPTLPTPTVPVPPPPTPTVSVPSLPTPTVPAPPPVTTSPTPLPVVTAPAVVLPPSTTTAPPATTVAGAARPSQPTTAAASPRAAGGRSSTSGASAPAARGSAAPSVRGRGSEGNRSGRPRISTRSRKLDARTLKTRDRVSVRLSFTLPKADRVFLIVRGPAPSCRIAGYIPVRGRKGANVVGFAGRVHGQRLDPGVYLISISPNRRLVLGAATEYVRVVSPRRSLPLPDAARKPSCNEARALAADPTARILLGETLRPTATLASLPTQPLRPPLQGSASANDEDENNADAAGFLPDEGVLGTATGDVGENPLATIAVLTIIGALLLTMLALVTRFFRGSWNP